VAGVDDANGAARRVDDHACGGRDLELVARDERVVDPGERGHDVIGLTERAAQLAAQVLGQLGCSWPVPWGVAHHDCHRCVVEVDHVEEVAGDLTFHRPPARAHHDRLDLRRTGTPSLRHRARPPSSGGEASWSPGGVGAWRDAGPMGGWPPRRAFGSLMQRRDRTSSSSEISDATTPRRAGR
jgi:hypothetical protein